MIEVGDGGRIESRDPMSYDDIEAAKGMLMHRWRYSESETSAVIGKLFDELRRLRAVVANASLDGDLGMPAARPALVQSDADALIVRLRCVSVVHAHAPTADDGSRTKTSETSSFGDADVPVDVLVDRKFGLHFHVNEEPGSFGRFRKGRIYEFSFRPGE